MFFRWWFALPLFLWLVLWSIAAFFVAFANWVTTLVRGSSPSGCHTFLARYVRFATHAYAYAYLAAEPLPNFDGKPGYPIDLEIDGPRRQNRWTVAFRIVLAIPPLLLASVLLGSSLYLAGSHINYSTPSLMGSAAILGWFAALAWGHMPRGLRDAVAFALSYGAQLWAYLLLLTDRYPSSDPLAAIGPLPAREQDPVRITVRDELRRSRLTVFFRLLLALPHLVWLALWGILAWLAAIVNWFATLFRARSPETLHRFLAAYVRYQNHVYAYLFLVANPFPGFLGRPGSYPVELTIRGPQDQNRWTVGFRLVLAIPAFVLAGAYGGALYVAAILGWFASLFTAKMPLGLRNLGVLALRYTGQANAYWLLLTDVYPYSGPTAPLPVAEPVAPPGTPPPLEPQPPSGPLPPAAA